MTRSALAMALALLALSACGGDDVADEAGFPVTLARVESIFLTERIQATGELQAKQHAEIAAEVGGRITEILIDEGKLVAQGDHVLAIDPERRTLEHDSARARAEEARESLRESEREMKRIRNLRERGVASQTQFEQAETNLKQSRSRLLAADAELGMTSRALADASVAAPFSGYIARRMVSRGEFVQQGQSLFELVSLDPIEVEFNVTEVESSRVALGQLVDVVVAPYPQENFVATVSFVSPTIDTRTRTLRVKALLENPDGRLRPGLFAKVDLGISSRDDVAMIPEDAVLQRADGHVVFRAVADDRVERVVVETGVHHDGMVEIRTGVRPGDWVVARGQAWLTDGQRVAPRHPDGTLAPGPLPPVAGEAAGRAANVP